MKRPAISLTAPLVLAAALALSSCGGASPPQPARPAPAPAADIEKTLFVAPGRKPCTGVAPMECLQVRGAPDQPWQYFYSEIEGFTHEPGYAYELRVREEKVANPAADASSLRWTLVRVVSKTAAGPLDMP